MLTVVARIRRWTRGLFYGWWVLASMIAVQILTTGFLMQSYGAYVAVLQPEFGWSITAFAGAYSLQQAVSGFLGPAQGWLLQRLGPRLVIRIGLVGFAAGMMLLSRVNSLAAFYAALMFTALAASLAGFMSTNTVTVNWFERRRSTALSLVQTGISVGGLLVPAVAWSLTRYGWRTTILAAAVLALLLGLPLTRFIHNRPEDDGLAPYGNDPSEPSAAAKRPGPDFSAREALRTRAFWFIAFGHGIGLAVVFAVLAHLVPYLHDQVGFSLQTAALLSALMTVMTIIGQLSGGMLGDATNKRLLAVVAMLGHAAALTLLAFGRSLPWVLAFAVVHGLSWGLRGPTMQALRADYFGRRAFAQILGFSTALITIGMVSGPFIVGLLADRSGSFATGFLVLAGLAVLGSVSFVFATPPVRRGGT